jgi:preprotein translocase subunit YajC
MSKEDIFMNSSTLLTFGPLILIVVIMYFLLIRPQKKREKQVNQMRASLKVGDEIITIGGICGKIVKTKDESIIVQVGADKLKFEMMKWSVSKVVESASRPAQKAEEEPEETAEEPKKSRPRRMKKAAVEEDMKEDADTDAAEDTEK